MPEIAKNLPPQILQHLLERMREREVSAQDVKQLIYWLHSNPKVPDTRWYKRFQNFTLCGEGVYPKTFLTRNQTPTGEEVF